MLFVRENNLNKDLETYKHSAHSEQTTFPGPYCKGREVAKLDKAGNLKVKFTLIKYFRGIEGPNFFCIT